MDDVIKTSLEQIQLLREFQECSLSIQRAQSVEEKTSKTSKMFQLLGQSSSRTAGTMSNYDQEDYYPTDKIFEILGKHTSSNLEDFFWYDDLKACLDMMNEKLGSPRLTNLHELWSSGFEDLELKRLERSLLTVQIVLDDIKREGKELRLWRVQYRHLKDLLFQAGEILDDIALRAPHLKQMFQSSQVTTHPYLTDKLLQINSLILELNNLAAEIKSMVLPEFTRRRKAPGPKIDSNVPSAMSSHEPPGEKNNHPAATPGAHNNPQSLDARNHLPHPTATIASLDARLHLMEDIQGRLVKEKDDLVSGQNRLLEITEKLQVNQTSMLKVVSAMKEDMYDSQVNVDDVKEKLQSLQKNLENSQRELTDHVSDIRFMLHQLMERADMHPPPF